MIGWVNVLFFSQKSCIILLLLTPRNAVRIPSFSFPHAEKSIIHGTDKHEGLKLPPSSVHEFYFAKQYFTPSTWKCASRPSPSLFYLLFYFSSSAASLSLEIPIWMPVLLRSARGSCLPRYPDHVVSGDRNYCDQRVAPKYKKGKDDGAKKKKLVCFSSLRGIILLAVRSFGQVE